jgi:hypothetical protein
MLCGGPYDSREKAEKDLQDIRDRNKQPNPDAMHRIVEEDVR